MNVKLITRIIIPNCVATVEPDSSVSSELAPYRNIVPSMYCHFIANTVKLALYPRHEKYHIIAPYNKFNWEAILQFF